MNTVAQFKPQPHPFSRPVERLALAVLLLCVLLSPAILNSAELSVSEAATPMVIGSGTYNGDHGDLSTFDFRARQADDSSIIGRFSACDPDAAVCVRNGGIRTLSIDSNTATFSGSGHLDDGTPVKFNATVIDAGPGNTDVISFHLSNGYRAYSTVVSGDIQVFD